MDFLLERVLIGGNLFVETQLQQATPGCPSALPMPFWRLRLPERPEYTRLQCRHWSWLWPRSTLTAPSPSYILAQTESIHGNPQTVLQQANTARCGDEAHITSFGGKFAVSLYSGTEP